MRKDLQIFAECPLIVTVDSSIYAEPLVSSIATGQPILKMGKVSPVPERKSALPKVTEFQVELDSKLFLFRLSGSSLLSKLGDEFHLRNM